MKNLIITLITIGAALSLALFPKPENWLEKVDPMLLTKVESGASAEFLILLKEEAEFEGVAFQTHKADKGHYVYEQLRHTARRSQKSLKSWLIQEEVRHQPFFIVNAIWARGNYTLIKRLAQRGDVMEIQYNPPMTFHRPTPVPETIRLREGIEWGVQQIKADKVWEMGIRGQGAVVAGGDTGYDWTHPTLSTNYRGQGSVGVDHNYNWHDAIHEISPIHGDSIISPELNPCGLNALIPCDDHGHGTHTMGTMVGDDGMGNQLGVAPDARWMACRNMERGYGSPATYIECFEFFLAPTDLQGNSPNPAMAPHVINNSWGCPPMEGCNPANFGIMDKVVKALKAAGIVVVASAGNSGSKCGSVDDPAAIFADVFSVGATKSDDFIASFSSRGPVKVDSSFRVKPDIVAPGVAVRSALPDSNYATWNGTSMAGPHVAGVVALMISANPNLAGQVDLIQDIIQETAKPLTDSVSCNFLPQDAIPNNAYGSGRVDAYLAVQKALELTDVDLAFDQNAVSIFPNPAREKISLGLSGFQGDVDLELFDASGRQLYRQSFNLIASYQVEELDLSGLPPGVYFYRLIQGKASRSGKIVLE